MKTKYIIIIIITVIAIFFLISFVMFNTINPYELTLPRTEYGTIDYVKIGYDVSLNDFKQKLDSQSVDYLQDKLILISGLSLTSYPPYTDYCGHVLDLENEDYWYTSSFHKTLTSSQIYDENPMPCKPNTGSCICSLQTKLSEKYKIDISYFDEQEQEEVGKRVQKMLNNTRIVNVPDKFVVGKYNHQIMEDSIPFCGAFVSELIKDPDPNKVLRDGVTIIKYFSGIIKGNGVIDFSGNVDSEKLCAINYDAPVLRFEKIYREN